MRPGRLLFKGSLLAVMVAAGCTDPIQAYEERGRSDSLAIARMKTIMDSLENEIGSLSSQVAGLEEENQVLKDSIRHLTEGKGNRPKPVTQVLKGAPIRDK